LPFLHIGLSTYHAKVYVGNKKREREREREEGETSQKGVYKGTKEANKKEKRGGGNLKKSDIALQNRIH
jgi:hypothetical protein